MRSICRLLILLCGVVVTSGCTTTLESSKLGVKEQKGLLYRLPAKNFSVKASYEITKCEFSAEDISLTASVDASFSEALVGAEAYIINYEALNALTKVTNTEFHLSENGLLTGFKSSISDHSGAVISNSVAAVVNVARAAVMPEVPNITLKKILSKEDEPCMLLNGAIAVKASLEKEILSEATKDKKRAEHQGAVANAKAKIQALTELMETYSKIGSESDKKSLIERIQEQERNKAKAKSDLDELGDSMIGKLQQSLSEAKKHLTITGATEFTPELTDDFFKATKVVTVERAQLRKFFPNITKLDNVNLPLVSIEVEKHSIIETEENHLTKADNDDKGIFYRLPATSVVRLCLTPNSGATSTLLLEKQTQVPQFGPIGILSLTNKAFDENVLDVEFSSGTGSPSKLVFQSLSKAEAASTAAREATSLYVQLQKDRREDRIATNKQLLEQATAQVTLEKAQSDLLLAKITSSASAAKTEFELQAAWIEGQIQLLRDQQRLDAIRTGTATTGDLELEALKTQEQLLAQQLKILKLQKEIQDQKENLP
jgi:hypothetical protein